MSRCVGSYIRDKTADGTLTTGHSCYLTIIDDVDDADYDVIASSGPTSIVSFIVLSQFSLFFLFLIQNDSY